MAETVPQRIDEIEEKLAAAGVYAPAAEARRIREHVAAGGTEAVRARVLESILARRLAREPLARILGTTEFCGLQLALAPDVFAPMGESESLVQHAVLLAARRGGACRVLDIGTGCGALLLAVLAELPQATGLGVDISANAVELARRNAAANGLAARSEFRRADLIEEVTGPFDLVLTNLPFVPSHLLPRLTPEVRLHEPRAALDGGRDGLTLYRRLLPALEEVLAPGGIWLVQTAIPALEGMTAFFRNAGFSEVERLDNHYGIPVALRVGLPRKSGIFQRFTRKLRAFAHKKGKF